MSRSLSAHVARFAHALRDRGVAASLSDEADALAVLPWIDLADREEVRQALLTALKIRPRDRAAFDDLFAQLWRAGLAPAAPRDAPRREPPEPRDRGRSRPGALPAGWPDPNAAPSAALPEGEEPGYSPEAVLRRKPFAQVTAAELPEMERLLSRLALRLATRPSRRLVPSRGRGQLDLRRSFRRMVSEGGELLRPARRAHPIELPRLVVLADTSGSMEPHTRFLLTFVLALSRVARGSEVFAFNTELVRLTPFLAPGRIDIALSTLAARVPDWSGGTRIGECLAAFAEHHLDERVNGRTTVIILSDGLDRGDVAPLDEALRAIKSRARRVLWLNPLAGDPRYAPTARAMAAALPYLDRLLPAHDLESLERLLPLLTA